MATGLNDERLAEIKQRTDAATPGPWEWKPFDSIYAPSVGLHIVRGNGSGVVDDDDAVFIALAREAIPQLIAEVDRLHAALAAAEAEVAQWREIGEKVSAIAEAGFYKDSEDHLVLYYEDFDSVVEQARALLAATVAGEGEGDE